MSGELLSRERIRELLTELGARLAAAGIKAELFLVDGAAMALAYNRKRATRDLDAVFEPKDAVYAYARRMADDLGLSPDWLNDAVKGLLPDRRAPESRVVIEVDGLAVAVAAPEYLFAMKALAARQEGDSDDVLTLARVLKITTPAQAYALVERYYSPSRLSAKTGLFLESLFNDVAAAARRPSGDLRVGRSVGA